MQTWEEAPTIENYRSHPFLASLERGVVDAGGAASGGHPVTSDQYHSPARPPAAAARVLRASSPGLPPRRCETTWAWKRLGLVGKARIWTEGLSVDLHSGVEPV